MWNLECMLQTTQIPNNIFSGKENFAAELGLAETPSHAWDDIACCCEPPPHKYPSPVCRTEAAESAALVPQTGMDMGLGKGSTVIFFFLN